MSNDRAVTGIEHTVPTGAVLASKTDLNGVITFANKAFIEISGYSKEELIGANHNLVRHPDMPSEAFKDLWQTVKSDRPWCGFVKNRCKNGDFYWVKATITPVIKNGKTVEYMSTRLKPTAEEVARAEQLYRDINSGQASLEKTKTQKWLHQVRSISLPKKLMLTMGGGLILIAAVSLLIGLGVMERMVETQEAYQLTAYLNAVNDKLDSEKRLAASMAALVAEMPVAQQAFAEDNRDELLRLYRAAFVRLKNEFGVRQFQFHQPPAVSYVRIHKPDKFGDDLSKKRPTVMLTNQSKKPVNGVDIGVFGLGIRGITPVFYQGEHIGSVEFGMSFGQPFFDDIKAHYGVDLAMDLFVEDGREPFASTLTEAVAVSETDIQTVKNGGKVIRYFSHHNIPVAVINAPVKDFAGDVIGILKIVVDRTEALNQIASIRNTLMLVSLAILAIGLFAAYTLSKSITTPLTHLVNTIHRIIAGEYNNNFDIKGDDEVGEALYSIQIMQARLYYNLQSVQEALEENRRVRTALDNVKTSVMVADAGHNIIYMNKAVAEMFTDAADDIRQELPDFDPHKLLGANMDIFHKQPGHQRKLIEQLKDTYESQLKIGSRTIRIITVPVSSENGERIGTAVEWLDETEILARQAEEEHRRQQEQEAERKAQELERQAQEEERRRMEEERKRMEKERLIAAENQRIRVALDNVSSNVMLANPEREIVYMNKSVQKLFSEAERDIANDLPGFNSSALLGSCMDQFHRNPAHQSSLLDTLTAPHSTEIEIGGRTLKIVTNPVNDSEGTRLGTAIEWTDRTQEVAVEKEIDSIVDAARSGNMDTRLDTKNKKGFFLQLSTSFNSLLDELTSVFSDISDVMGGVAKGDLRQTITGDYQGIFGEVKTNINQSIANVERTVVHLRGISEQVLTAASEIATGNTNLSARTEQQAASLDETGSSMAELTGTVKQNADRAQDANSVSTTTRVSAERGGDIVNQAVAAMEKISESSNKIAEIIGVIDTIAFQTNLLALNASVEAARAGEKGRGFAVVATEVRNLASRSAEAAKEISKLIKDSVEKVEDGAKLVNQTGESLHEIVDGVQKVSQIIAEIAASSAQQSNGIDQVNKAVEDMEEVTQQNAALAEETSAASVMMSENAANMQQAMNFFSTSQHSQDFSAKQEINSAPQQISYSHGQKSKTSSADDEWSDF